MRMTAQWLTGESGEMGGMSQREKNLAPLGNSHNDNVIIMRSRFCQAQPPLLDMPIMFQQQAGH